MSRLDRKVYANAQRELENTTAAVGLWNLKGYGYPASQFVAGFYIYASVIIISEAVQGDSPYPIEIVLPQIVAVVVAFILVFYLWRMRGLF